MKSEKILIRLNKDEIFGKVRSIDIEESDVMKNHNFNYNNKK